MAFQPWDYRTDAGFARDDIELIGLPGWAEARYEGAFA